jgi:hypothetical protein
MRSASYYLVVPGTQYRRAFGPAPYATRVDSTVPGCVGSAGTDAPVI